MLPFFTVIDADTCRSVTVVEISNENGDVGKYFMSSAEEFSKMVGDIWDVHYTIVQSGSRSWEGRIDVSKVKDTAFGKKSFGSAAAGDWKVNDTITLKSCSNPDKHPCKDVTFGKCNPDSIVISNTSQQTVQLCNAECNDTNNCTNYRFNNETKECNLMTDEYRGLCKINAGPMDKKVTDCLGQISSQICDSHLEEDCKYTGELLHSFPKGAIGDADTCQIECESFKGCKYWIFNNHEDKCILKKDGRKTCNVWGGPKEPSFEYCKCQ